MTKKTVVEYDGDVTFLPNKKDPIVARFEHIYGHPRFPDSKCVTSSKIISIADDGEIETINTVYRPRSK